IKSERNFEKSKIEKLCDNDGDQILAFKRKDLVFVFNFHPNRSFSDYGILAPCGEYKTILNSDAPQYGGFGQIDESVSHFTLFDPLYKKAKKEWLKLYIPARSAIVLKWIKPAKPAKKKN
ncbi:MAG: alpha amylase C-terminal domain-containing protein, partial [Coprobacter sp.]|nr:alpha amylase C-terminal domain-containing protein [Coprobacter sp.]